MAKMETKITPAMEREWHTFLSTKGEKFRRQNFVDHLVTHIRGMNWNRAKEAAAIIWDKAVKAGEIVRGDTNIHWKVASSKVSGVKLLSGRTIPEMDREAKLTIKAKAPGRWVAVNLQTGAVWTGTPVGWISAQATEIQEAHAVLSREVKAK